MHETILKAVTIGVVGGLIVYWLTSKDADDGCGRAAHPGSYAPLVGDVRVLPYGNGTAACCYCCGLPVPENTTIPLAADYLCNVPDYAAPVSDWNLGVSLQISCKGLDANIYREETASTFPHGVSGQRTTPPPVILVDTLSCSPCVPAQTQCTEVV